MNAQPDGNVSANSVYTLAYIALEVIMAGKDECTAKVYVQDCLSEFRCVIIINNSQQNDS